MTVGLTLYGLVNLIGHISGCCVNPAIGLVQSGFQRITYDDDKHKGATMFAFYTLAPALGGCFAGLF